MRYLDRLSSKASWLLVIAITLFGSRSNARTLPNSGPLIVKLVVSSQASFDATVSKTNSSSSNTTITSVSKNTVSNAVFQTSDLLAAVENSFNTNFPAGAQLTLSRNPVGFSIAVTDSSGANVWLNLSTNCFVGMFSGASPLYAGVRTDIFTTNNAGPSESGNDSETMTECVILGYDDAGLATRDGTHTHFQITCLLTGKSSQDLVSNKLKETVKLQGNGYGMLRGQNVILQGSATAQLSGIFAFAVPGVSANP